MAFEGIEASTVLDPMDLQGRGAAKARAFEEQALARLDAVKLPELQKLQIQQMVEQGQLTPEQAQAYLVDGSALGGISLDPKLQKAQEDALASLQDIAQNKGLTDMDRAQLAQIGTEEDTAARGQREAILQNMQSRGLGGSGMELLAQLQNQQDSATRRSARDTSVAGMAQQRALQSLQQAGQLGGQMQQSDFARQAQMAEASDAINKFNAQNQQQVGLANVGARNEAQAANLANKQRVADQNVQLSNQEQAYNKGLDQQNFNNQIQKATGGTNTIMQQAAGARGDSAATGQKVGAIGGAVAAAFSDERLKDDISDFDASEFLDSITPSKYRYKSPKHGKGMYAGVMAQDLEKTDVGRSLVEDTPKGKMVDYGKGFGTLLAALGDVNDRLKKVEEQA